MKILCMAEKREARSACDDISHSRLQTTITNSLTALTHRQNLSYFIERLFRKLIEAYNGCEKQG